MSISLYCAASDIQVCAFPLGIKVFCGREFRKSLKISAQMGKNGDQWGKVVNKTNEGGVP